jgi:hypothetical protein
MKTVDNVTNQWPFIETSQRLIAAAHPAGKSAGKDNARYPFHLFIPGAFASMTGILILRGAEVLIIDNALFARKHDKALAQPRAILRLGILLW